MDGRTESIGIGRETINNIRYVDDTAILAESLTDLQAIADIMDADTGRLLLDGKPGRIISMQLQKKSLKWPTLLYACETWTLKAATINKLEAFELWCYRRIRKIPWIKQTPDEYVLRMIEAATIKWRNTEYLGQGRRKELDWSMETIQDEQHWELDRSTSGRSVHHSSIER
ncbi:hypothetical protein HUJ05_007809 [Dendroctonus ponderosae]|nr:hypothetical protein HUJ05_007809 [Dendroctonus ponderosae]